MGNPKALCLCSQTTDVLFRNDLKQVSSILKRAGNSETNADPDDEEEESAYNDHFKNNVGPPGPGEFRVPTVRVRQGQQGAATTTATSHTTDYTGTRLDQGEGLGVILSKVFLFQCIF